MSETGIEGVSQGKQSMRDNLARAVEAISAIISRAVQEGDTEIAKKGRAALDELV